MSLYIPGHRTEYPDGVTARDIDGDDMGYIYCNCGGDLINNGVCGLVCSSCGKKLGMGGRYHDEPTY